MNLKFALLLLSVIFPLAVISEAAVINAASCNQEDVQSAIDAANDGDTVNVPAGSCTITTQITVTNKNITIKGAGIDATTFNANIISGTRPGVFKITTKPARITGFTFNGTAPAYGAHLVFEGTGDETALFRADNNKFTVNSGYAILTWNLSYGVIDHNTFTTNADHSFINLYADNRTSWARESSLGTNKGVYVEDNTFTNSANTANNRAVSPDGGSRFVFRNNTVTNLSADAHGYCGTIAGTMSYEIYDNTWSVTSETNMFRWMFLRGGSGVIYNNVLTNNGIRQRDIDMTEYRLSGLNSCSGSAETMCTSYPCLDQIGRSTNQVLDPLYYWNNTVNGSAANISVNQVIDSAWAGSTSYLSNYYVVPTVSNGYYYSAAVAGTSGALEPFWPATIGNTVTDNNITWTNMGSILEISNVIQQNRDYYIGIERPGYAPYTYPHPLTVESDTTPPTKPAGFRLRRH